MTRAGHERAVGRPQLAVLVEEALAHQAGVEAPEQQRVGQGKRSRKWTVSSMVGAGASLRRRGHGAGNHASASRATVSASIGRSSRSPIQPPTSERSAPLNGGAPKRVSIVTRPVKGGGARRPGATGGISRAEGGATSGISASEITGPGRGADKAASASAISSPSCSRRAVTVVSERPARSTAARSVTAPAWGARRKWMVIVRG